MVGLRTGTDVARNFVSDCSSGGARNNTDVVRTTILQRHARRLKPCAVTTGENVESGKFRRD